jgi:hypothetical protein
MDILSITNFKLNKAPSHTSELQQLSPTPRRIFGDANRKQTLLHPLMVNKSSFLLSEIPVQKMVLFSGLACKPDKFSNSSRAALRIRIETE